VRSFAARQLLQAAISSESTMGSLQQATTKAFAAIPKSVWLSGWRKTGLVPFDPDQIIQVARARSPAPQSRKRKRDSEEEDIQRIRSAMPAALPGSMVRQSLTLVRVRARRSDVYDSASILALHDAEEQQKQELQENKDRAAADKAEAAAKKARLADEAKGMREKDKAQREREALLKSKGVVSQVEKGVCGQCRKVRPTKDTTWVVCEECRKVRVCSKCEENSSVMEWHRSHRHGLAAGLVQPP